MRSEKLMIAMGAIDDRFIIEDTDAPMQETDTSARKKAAVSQSRPALRPIWRFAPAVAGLAVLVTVVLILGANAGWFSHRVDTVDLGDSGIVSFYNSGAPGAGSLDLGVGVTGRDLTPTELQILFGDLPDTSAYGLFSADHALLHLEGHSGGTKIILAAPGLPTADYVLEGNEKTSTIDGVDVTAGYFLTDPNSQGTRNIIYFAQFMLGDVPAYAENGGPEADAETYRTDIAIVIETLIHNGEPQLTSIQQ